MSGRRANDVQVGGDHYKKASFQPWDWDRYGVGSLECNIIKYVTRYREKNGLEDLNKAHHYVMKLIEEYTYHDRSNRCRYEQNSTHLNELKLEYVMQWGLDMSQIVVINYMLTWISVSQLRPAAEQITRMIDAYSASDVQPAEPAPSTDYPF